MTAPRIDSYHWSGGREAMLRFGPEHGPTVIAALPLFEEANRTRAAMVDVLRRLAARGIAGALPDLPGTGESIVPTEAATLAGWRAAFAAAVSALPGPVHVVAWRGGALVDRDVLVASRWWLAPLSGADTMRELRRVRAASGGTLYAGNCLSEAMIAELDSAEFHQTVRPEPVEGRPSASDTLEARRASTTPDQVRGRVGTDGAAHRIVRLDSDPRAADAKLPGRPLWRGAEPGTDAALQALLADDIASWIARCAG